MLTRLETSFNNHTNLWIQLAAAIIGERRNFYQERLAMLWAVTNNIPYSQFRNVAERKVSMLKRTMKQLPSGLPGPQRVCVDIPYL